MSITLILFFSGRFLARVITYNHLSLHFIGRFEMHVFSASFFIRHPKTSLYLIFVHARIPVANISTLFLCETELKVIQQYLSLMRLTSEMINVPSFNVFRSCFEHFLGSKKKLRLCVAVVKCKLRPETGIFRCSDSAQ